MGTGARQLLADRYTLLSPLRRDGGGIMWHAHDLRLKRDVAIKEVQPPYRVDAADLRAARRQALREARSAARLSHPAIITVHDLLEDRGRLWIVTELLKGLTLTETVQHLGRLPVHWAAWVGFQLLSGVRHAHAMDVVHGDIRPGNVVLTEDRVVLTDFGISALEKDAGSSTTVPMTRSAAYLSPERMRGEALASAMDLWSFGATLYFGVEGRPPYPGMGPLSAGMVLTREPEPPRRAGPLGEVLEGLLRRDPDERLGAERATAMLVDILRRQGIPAAAPGRSSRRDLPSGYGKGWPHVDGVPRRETDPPARPAQRIPPVPETGRPGMPYGIAAPEPETDPQGRLYDIVMPGHQAGRPGMNHDTAPPSGQAGRPQRGPSDLLPPGRGTSRPDRAADRSAQAAERDRQDRRREIRHPEAAPRPAPHDGFLPLTGAGLPWPEPPGGWRARERGVPPAPGERLYNVDSQHPDDLPGAPQAT
ncbi:protein kinase [Microbispora sp. NPDC049125]|uniref:serine/threonine-protein kinase n=1 Tax=Microbispora sp. NPDC049125 TaxID=3154929 RepID=UPI003467237B